MKKILQNTGLLAYRALAGTGVMRLPGARRAFVAAYSAYKTLIESGPISRLQEYVPAGSLVIDVGANVGFFTLKFVDWVGESGRVIAIEPDQENFQTLKAKLDRGGTASRVDLHNAALADKVGHISFMRNEFHPGDHRITQAATGLEVPTDMMDNLAFADTSRPLSLVKIDVQGAEMLVLSGAVRTLAECRPALFVEIDDGALSQFGSSAQALVSHIEEAGYRMYRLEKYGPPSPLDHGGLARELFQRSYIDALFLPT